MKERFIFKSEKIGEIHLETTDVKLPDAIKDNLHDYPCFPKFSFNGFELVSDNLKLLEYPCFFEWQTIKVVFTPYEYAEHESFSLLINDTVELVSDYYGGKPQIIGNILIKNYVGNTIIKVVNKYNETLFEFSTEIFPQKLNYKEDFKEMIAEITEILYSLIYDYLKKTYSIVTPNEPQHSTITEWLAILKALFDSLEKSLQLILRSPHSKIITTKRITQVDKIRKINNAASKWIVKNQRHLSADSSDGFEMEKEVYTTILQESRKRITHNTFENRFIKWAVNSIILKIEMIRHEIKTLHLVKADFERADSELIVFRKKLLRYLMNPVFHQVEEFRHQMDFSTVLTMAPGYKDFYFRFLLLRRGLSINDNDIFKLDYKDIATLYEYWCFLKTIKILKEEPFSYNLESTDIIKIEHNRFSIGLRKGEASEIKFSKIGTNESFLLAYNREFTTPTYSQVPDNFIEFKKGKEYKNPFRYIMDAKYRFTREDENYPEAAVKNGPPLDTIAQLHRYRDSILSKSNTKGTYAEAIKSLGGIILFPFPNSEEGFKDHRFFKSIKEVNIGAIPLRPGSQNNLYKDFLLELLETSPEYLYEQTINYDKSDYHRLIDQMSMPVLIGTIPKNDFEQRYQLLNNKLIYYIPEAKEYLIRPEDIRYVAIHHENSKTINGYAEVRQIEKASAKDLTKLGATWHLRSESYVVFHLNGLKPCNIPFSMIGSMGRRYSNFFSLQKAMESGMQNVIFLANPEQIRMWKEITALDSKVQILRTSRYDRINKKDESEISLQFSFKDKNFTCIQSTRHPKEFFINDARFEFSDNFRTFLLNLINTLSD